MTGTNLDAPARQILDLIRLARVLHVDETSLSLNGKLVWVWIFFDPETGNTLFVIRPSRGGDVLREVIPEWGGTIVSGGWGPYKKYRVQRCWAHILREIRHLARRNPDCQEAQDTLAVLSRVHRCGLRASGSMRGWCVILLRPAYVRLPPRFHRRCFGACQAFVARTP